MAVELLEIVVAVASGVAGGLVTYRVEESKLRKKYQLQDSSERAARALLADREWRLRSFKVLRHHLAGFEDNALRQILVRCGAIRFMSKSGEELWGLLDRNSDRLGVTRIDSDPANLDDRDIFGVR
jgi:hypothetical protein